MLDLAQHWPTLIALAYASEMAYRRLERKATKVNDEAADRLAHTLRLGLDEATRWTPFGVVFEIRLARHYHWIRKQGAKWPEEWKI